MQLTLKNAEVLPPPTDPYLIFVCLHTKSDSQDDDDDNDDDDDIDDNDDDIIIMMITL